MIDHWMTTGLLGANASFQRAAREYAEEYAAMAVAAERKLVRGGNDLEAMCEAFHRLIEAHAQRSPRPYPTVRPTRFG